MRPPAVSRLCNPAVGHLVVDCWRRRSPLRRTRDCFAALPGRDQTSCVQGGHGPAPHTPLCTGARHGSILHRSPTTRGSAVDMGAVAGCAPPCRHDAPGARTRGDFGPRRARGARAVVGAQGLGGRRTAHRGPAVAAAIRSAGLGDDARGGFWRRTGRRSVPAWAQGGPPPRPRAVMGLARPHAAQAPLHHLEGRGLQGSAQEELPSFRHWQGAILLSRRRELWSAVV
jgi:hypothetical protein